MTTYLLIIPATVVAAYVALVWLGGRLLLTSVRRPRRRPLQRGAAEVPPPPVRDDFTLMA